jgi:hypothetical protein
MPGLRINFHKSEVMVLGATTGEPLGITNMLNCKQVSFLVTYPGLPIGERAITAVDGGLVMTKVARREDPCMDKFISSVERRTLINAASSISDA